MARCDQVADISTLLSAVASAATDRSRAQPQVDPSGGLETLVLFFHPTPSLTMSVTNGSTDFSIYDAELPGVRPHYGGGKIGAPLQSRLLDPPEHLRSPLPSPGAVGGDAQAARGQGRAGSTGRGRGRGKGRLACNTCRRKTRECGPHCANWAALQPSASAAPLPSSTVAPLLVAAPSALDASSSAEYGGTLPSPAEQDLVRLAPPDVGTTLPSSNVAPPPPPAAASAASVPPPPLPVVPALPSPSDHGTTPLAGVDATLDDGSPKLGGAPR